MTFKSIETILAEVDGTALHRFIPKLDPDEAIKRELYVTSRIHNFINGKHASKADRDYYARIRAALGDFVKGEPIDDDETVLKKLHPKQDEIWEFRVTFSPQSRLFGAFGGVDIFIALEPSFREKLAKEGFDGAMEKVRNGWAGLFGSKRRFAGSALAFCICNVRSVA